MSDHADLGEHLERYVDVLVESGRFESRNDVLREGVRLIEEKDKRLTDLDAALAAGLASADAGRVKPLDVVADRLIAKYQAMARARGA